MKLLALLLFLTSYCWAKVPQSRIVGGQLARPGQFPFVAAVFISKPGGSYFCAGSLINNQWILTAGQCVYNAIQFTIYLRSTSLNGEEPNRITLATNTWFIHPNFAGATLNNDIGLIKLRLPVSFNEYVGSVQLPTAHVGNYVDVIAIGYGQLGDFDSSNSDLHQVGLSTLSNEDCQKIYGNQIVDEMLCVAGNWVEGTCNGDSGGPLVSSGPGGYVIAGVSSFQSNNGCENTDPSGFTRVYNYLTWINETVSNN